MPAYRLGQSGSGAVGTSTGLQQAYDQGADGLISLSGTIGPIGITDTVAPQTPHAFYVQGSTGSIYLGANSTDGAYTDVGMTGKAADATNVASFEAAAYRHKVSSWSGAPVYTTMAFTAQAANDASEKFWRWYEGANKVLEVSVDSSNINHQRWNKNHVQYESSGAATIFHQAYTGAYRGFRCETTQAFSELSFKNTSATQAVISYANTNGVGAFIAFPELQFGTQDDPAMVLHASSGMLFRKGGVIVRGLTDATAITQTVDSIPLTIRGSYWNGAAAVNADHSLVARVFRTTPSPRSYLELGANFCPAGDNDSATARLGIEPNLSAGAPMMRWRSVSVGSSMRLTASDATVGTPLVNSPTMFYTSKWWDGAASQQFFCDTFLVQSGTSAAQAYYAIFVNAFGAGQDKMRFYDDGRVLPGTDNTGTFGSSATRWAKGTFFQYGGVVQSPAWSATIALDPTLGETVRVVFDNTANLGVWTLAAGIAGQLLTVIFVNDATGHTIGTPPANILWAGATAPTLSGANKTDVFTLRYDSAISKWLETGRALNVG